MKSKRYPRKVIIDQSLRHLRELNDRYDQLWFRRNTHDAALRDWLARGGRQLVDADLIRMTAVQR